MSQRNHEDLYETETVARLHADQGRPGEAIAIYRRLCEKHPAHAGRARWEERIRVLTAQLRDEDTDWVPLQPESVEIPPAPGVVAVAGRDDDGRDHAVVAWALPATAGPPVLQVLLVTRGPDGVETDRRQVAVGASSGRITLHANGLASAIAAAGHLDASGQKFVPLVRSTAR